MPGMPSGKAAGEACLHLQADFRCALWGKPERPLVCQQFRADVTVCGDSRAQAMQILTLLEQST